MKKRKRDYVIIWVERADRNKIKKVAAERNKSIVELITEYAHSL